MLESKHTDLSKSNADRSSQQRKQCALYQTLPQNPYTIAPIALRTAIS